MSGGQGVADADRSEKTVLTTGANSSFGIATVVEVARRGFRSVGTVRSRSKAKIVAKAAAEAGVGVDTVVLDVTDVEACREVIHEVRPHGLVNNAGYMPYSAVEEVVDDEAGRQLETLVVGPIRLARLAIPHMRERGGGRIIQVSSLSGRASFPLMGWYQGAKQALEGISDALRMEVARDGIAVILVEPGVFKTRLTQELSSLADSGDSRYAGVYARIRRRLSVGDRFWGEPEGVASTIGSALTTRFPRARYVVGKDATLNMLTAPFTPTPVQDRALRWLAGLQ